MAKSNYIHGFLFIAAVFVCGGVGSFTVIQENQEPRAKNQEEYQVSVIKLACRQAGIKYHETGLVLRKSVSLNKGSFSNDRFSFQTSDVRPPASTLQLQKRVKSTYDSQIGVRETGVNRGPEVEKYLRYVNLPKGNPWCAAFVCWVLGKAGVSNPRTGWSPGLFPVNKIIWVRGERGKVATPTTSDLFGLYFPEKKRIAHVGFIDAWDDKWLITVEGNTNISGEREGDGIYRKRRLVRSIYRVARYINQPVGRQVNNSQLITKDHGKIL